MYNSVSLFIGVLISVMIMINGTLSAASGNYAAVVIIHLVGLLGIIIAMLPGKAFRFKLKGIPLYLYSAGTIGIFTVLFNNMGYAALGVSLPLALGLFGQLLASLVIDHFGLFQMKKIRFEKKKFMGLAIIFAGILVMAFL